MIDCTVMRGLSEAYGSWNTICICWRKARMARLDRFSTSSPRNFTEPDVAGISRRIRRPVVDLPQPDSPTTPNVWPFSTDSDTPDTALMVAT